MKCFIIICFLVVAIGPCARAKSFNFGNLFFGSNKKAPEDTESAIPRSASENIAYESNPSEYSADIDSDAFNTSSDDIFDYDYQNSSADSLEISSRNESDDVPAIFKNKTAEVEAVQSNETHSSHKVETTTAAASSTVTSEKTSTLAESASTAGVSKESPNTTVTEQEEVVLGTTTGGTVVLVPKTFFQKSIDWVEDAYTLSILIPITAGILFATTIIVVIALCRCLRRCCRRRRFKRKPLPDSVKNLRPADRKRLLGDSSDEEF